MCSRADSQVRNFLFVCYTYGIQSEVCSLIHSGIGCLFANHRNCRIPTCKRITELLRVRTNRCLTGINRHRTKCLLRLLQNSSVVVREGYLIEVRCKISRQFRIQGQNNRTLRLGVSIRPSYKMISFSGNCDNRHRTSLRIKTFTGNRSCSFLSYMERQLVLTRIDGEIRIQITSTLMNSHSQGNDRVTAMDRTQCHRLTTGSVERLSFPYIRQLVLVDRNRNRHVIRRSYMHIRRINGIH